MIGKSKKDFENGNFQEIRLDSQPTLLFLLDYFISPYPWGKCVLHKVIKTFNSIGGGL